MKLKFFILFIIIESLMILSINFTNSIEKNNLLEQKTKEMQRQYKSITNYFDKIARTVFEGYINRDNNIIAFEHRDRILLHNLLKNDYNYIKSIDIAQVHFHLPNHNSFLRLHKPEMYGDSLTNARYSVEFVSKNHKSINGIEIGKVLPGFRYLYPLFNKNNEYIGSVENSFSIMAFINQLESLYKVHTHFLLNKDLVDNVVVKSSKGIFAPAVEQNSFYKLNTENCKGGIKRADKYKLFSQTYKTDVENGIKTKEAFSFEFIINDITKIVTFLPMINIEKRQIGYFVLYYKDNDLALINSNIYKRYIIFGTIILLLFIVLYIIFSQKKMLTLEVKKQASKYHRASKELGLKTKELNRLNRTLEDEVKNEIEKNRKKEFELMEASKMVQMGEMIGNIAHQWRQPLSLISTISTSVLVNKEYGLLTDNDLISGMEKINNSSQYLSETIDTFRDFIKEEKVLKEQILQDNISNAIDIVGTVLKDVNIKLIKDIDCNNPINVTIVSGELPQVIINIINNAKDILLEKDLDNKLVKISLEKLDTIAIITIEDNGGGVPTEILPNIFNPYFTTKHQSVGTGLGLHMSKRIVEESLKGKLYVENSENGAKFFIEIPLK